MRFHSVPASAPSFVGPYVVDLLAPFGRELNFQGVYWTADPALKTSPNNRPIVSVGDIALYSLVAQNEGVIKALELALALADPHRETRLLVLSDGQYTGADPSRSDLTARLSLAPVWYRLLEATRTKDVAAGRIEVPGHVEEGAGFLIRFSIHSQSEAVIHYTLSRESRVLARGDLQLRPGTQTLLARDRVRDVDMANYRLKVSTEADGRPENDVSQALVMVASSPRVIIVSQDGVRGRIASALENGGLLVDVAPASRGDWSPALLARYQVVLLEDVPMNAIGTDGATSLAEAVRMGVCGLIVSGGEHSFGPGGYHRSPLDPILPVSMELKEEQRRGIIALIAVLDRSGSMGTMVNGGLTKMDLANAGVAEAIRFLSSSDELSVIAVDSKPHVIVPLVQADNTAELIRLVRRIKSMGGGIFVRTALQAAALEARRSSLSTRHIILFADAADAEEREDSVSFARHLQREGIGISVIGLGTPADSDARFLMDLARAGDGNIQFTNRPQELPRVFAQEVIRISQRGFIRQTTPLRVLPDLLTLGLPLDSTPDPLGAYNPTRLRSEASCALATADESEAPLVSFRRRGRGMVAAITAPLDSPLTGEFAHWDRLQTLLLNLVRMSSTEAEPLDAKLSAVVRRGELYLELEATAEMAEQLRALPNPVRLLGPPGSATLDVPLSWKRHDTATASVQLTQPGHYLPVLDLGDDGRLEAPPVTLSYSPEFAPWRQERDGAGILESLARDSGGRELTRVDEVFDTRESRFTAGRKDLSSLCALLMLVLLLLEIAERRMGIGAWIHTRKR